MRCRTTTIDVLRGSQFATATGSLVRVLFAGGCVSAVILFWISILAKRRVFFGATLPLGEGNVLKVAELSGGDWAIPRPFPETSSSSRWSSEKHGQ